MNHLGLLFRPVTHVELHTSGIVGVAADGPFTGGVSIVVLPPQGDPFAVALSCALAPRGMVVGETLNCTVGA